MDRFVEKDLKLTPQRLAILEFLEGNTGHPTAGQVFTAVRRRYPSMSHSTVYNTLKTLRDRGALRELTIDPERKHYDPNTAPHHHLLCVGCGSIVDIFRDYDVSIPAEVENEYEILGNHVEIFGFCPGCRKTKPRQTPRGQ